MLKLKKKDSNPTKMFKCPLIFRIFYWMALKKLFLVSFTDEDVKGCYYLEGLWRVYLVDIGRVGVWGEERKREK